MLTVLTTKTSKSKNRSNLRLPHNNDAQDARAHLSLAVVIPAHNAADHLAQCLNALLVDGTPADAIVVVNDGSSDITAQIARDHGVVLLETEDAVGPAAARNLGVVATKADVVLFVDADVVVARGTRNRVIAAFATPGAPDALFGSYDDAPMAPRWVSQYRNLLHHYTHQTADRTASTFWTGLGAVTRSAFDRAGGFDADRRYLEDVSFGRTIVAAGGRITLDPDIQGKHLKDWTLGNMFWTDWKGRAVPWARMQARGEIDRMALRTGRTHQISAGLVWLALLGGALLTVTAFGVWIVLIAVLGFVWLNAGLFRLLLRRGGPMFAAASIGYHALHYLAATMGLIEVRVFERNRSDQCDRRTD
ncbi:MAG: glycosyltransferase family 2 protein [Pseudomonadota bacterium]